MVKIYVNLFKFGFERGFHLALFFLFIIVCHSVSGKRLSLNQQASKTSWLKLLHFRDGVSEVDGANFFLTENGRRDPSAELKGLIKAVESRSLKKICRFPARFQWYLKNIGGNGTSIDLSQCKDYQRFAKKLSAKSVSIVFSSFYLNNPASIFGHTLLKINHQTDQEIQSRKYDLLDFGVNYGATNFSQNAILYALGGLFGWFKGKFAAIPYYYKVREYNDFESRDLWSYQLNLTSAEVKMLVAHIWELGHTYFDYYFLSENCSYHILGAIEAAAPRLNLVNKFWFYVIPIETIKELYKVPGLVKHVSYRPSIKTRFFHKLGQLKKAQLDHFEQLLIKEGPSNILDKNLSKREKIEILDTYIDYLDYKFGKKILKEEKDETLKKRKALLARSKIHLASRKSMITALEQNAPHLSHPPQRLGSYYQYNSTTKQKMVFLDFKFALHDILDLDTGYLPNSRINVFHFNGGMNLSDSAFVLNNFSIFSIKSLTPINRYTFKFSWKLNVGTRRIIFEPSYQRQVYGINAGLGLTKKNFKSVDVYLMADTDLGASEKSKGKYFVAGVGSEAGMIYNFGQKVKGSVTLDYKYYLLQKTSRLIQAFDLQFNLNKFWSVRLEGQKVKDEKKFGVGWHWYY